jgi:hypothetical protein
MYLEEAKVLVEDELKKISPFWLIAERAEYLRYDDDKIVVSISDMRGDIMVTIECVIGETELGIRVRHATPETIKSLFAEYKRIKGE